MFTLEVIKAMNNHPTKIKDNFNRDCSFVYSRGGFVVHSAAFRSTLYFNPAEFPETSDAFAYWKDQGQVAVNAFVDSLANGCDPLQCEINAFCAACPDWTLTQPKSTGKGARESGAGHVTAYRVIGSFHERVSSVNVRGVHAKITKGDAR